VDESSTGSDALDKAAGRDLIVLDVHLPDLSGFEVCRRLRARPETAHIPVLHLSAALTDAHDQHIGLKAGADGYLIRPVDAAVLVATVRTLLFARHAEQLRLDADAKFAAMFKFAPTPMATLDAEQRYESVNPAYCALTGYAADEIVGRSASEFAAPGALTPLAASEVAVRPDLALWEGVLPLQRKDGSVVQVEWRVAREPVNGVCIVLATDITRRLQAEAERESLLTSERAARAEAERSNRLKDDFLATLSHELRNPLNAIVGWASVLRDVSGLPPLVSRGIDAIDRNSKMQTQLIADLLDYAGITFGKMRLSREPVCVAAAIQAAVDAQRAAAASKGIELHCETGDGTAVVHADPGRLQQIVWNLLSNAIKFTPSGGRIWISGAAGAVDYRIVVRDNGKGIAPEFLPRLFERFSQQDAGTNKTHGGLGIGLSIVKHLVALHGGSVAVDSAGENRGATFTVVLPLAREQRCCPGAAMTHDGEDCERPLWGTIAMVVEDDRDARELVCQILADAGAQAIEADCADSAIRRIAGSAVNLLISDIGMPLKDGYTLLRELRRCGYDAERLPAIALTAFASVQDRNSALAAGFDDHVAKPIDTVHFIQRVAALRRLRQGVDSKH
jgi:PAS domain S-box-containing protein